MKTDARYAITSWYVWVSYNVSFVKIKGIDLLYVSRHGHYTIWAND